MYEATGEWPGRPKLKKKQTVPWSETKEKKQKKKEKRLKRKAKKRKPEMTEEDFDELLKDVSLMKRLKKKKVNVSVSSKNVQCALDILFFL